MISEVWSNLEDRLFFSVEDIAELKGIAITSNLLSAAKFCDSEGRYSVLTLFNYYVANDFRLN